MFGRIGKKKGNYPYVVARVKAMKSHLMGDDSYQKMMLMSLPEISRFISESGYSKEITDLASKFDGINLIEHATYKNMASCFRNIYESSNGELKDILAADLDRWNIWNIKIILRSKSYGLKGDDVIEDLVPAGSLGLPALEKLMAIESIEDCFTAYGKMTGMPIPQEVFNDYKEKGNLSPIEDFLVKYHYENLLRTIDANSRPMRLYQDFIRLEIDLINLETILKLKLEGISGENVMKYVISGGKSIDKKLATQLANAESISATVNDLAQLDFYEDIKDALDANHKSLREIVAGLRKYKVKQSRTFSHLYPLSVIPIIDFMIHKENEVNNIRIIARGIESGLDKDTINELLVV